MFRKIFFLLLFFSFCSAALESKGDSEYLWPMMEFRELSSGFGDHRSFHFHSGIDIPTQKKTGYEVLAPQSGWVYRIYASWWGYGKALYLRLEDGRLALFGHLSDFSAGIKDFVRQKQQENQSYFLDFFPDENQIRVRKGEVVGYSGESGTGGPHLHFELRDEENQPLNPLTHGFPLEEGTPPVIDRIALRPLGINSFVNGKDEVVILPLISDSVTESFTVKDAPVVSGRIGLELKAYDPSGRRRLGIYKSSAYLNDELIFSCAYDTFNFASTWMVELDRDFQLLRQGKGHFYKLYVDSGNALNLYRALGPDKGVIDTERYYSLSQENYASGAHRIKIRVEDACGNLSQAQFFVIFDRKPEINITQVVQNEQGLQIKGKVIDDDRFSRIEIGISPLDELRWMQKTLANATEGNDFELQENIKSPTLIRLEAVDVLGLESDPQYLVLNPDESPDSSGPGEMNLDMDYSFEDGFLTLALRFDTILRKKPQLSLKVGGFQFSPLILREIDERSYQAVYPFSQVKEKEVLLEAKCKSVLGDSATLVKKIPLSIASALFSGGASSEDGMAKIKIDSGTVHRPVELSIRKIPSRRATKQKGNIYSFEPKDVPFAKYAWISLSYEEANCAPGRLALYEYRNKTWRFVGNELDSEAKTLSGRVRYLSTYALMEDKKAPKVKIVYPSKGRKIKNRLPEIHAQITDDLSGFGSEEAITVTIDGIWTVPEYDPEKGILKTTPSRPLSYGWHTLRIEAEDQVENRSVTERKFKVIK